MVKEKVFYEDKESTLFVIGDVLGYNDDGELEIKKNERIVRIPKDRIVKREEQ